MTRPPAGPAARIGRILVVEDSPSARRLLQDVLVRLGAELPNVRMAGTVVEALETFTSWRPDVVFIDIELGEPTVGSSADARSAPPAESPKDGAALALLFRSRNPNVKLIVCSATDPSDRRVADLVAGGTVEVVLKPLLASRVEAALDRLLPAATSRPG
jgi:CheY-like chemotaxis protein